MARSSSRSNGNPEPIERLIDRLQKLPGIGRRSAERMAFHVLKSSRDDALALAQAVRDVKERIGVCSVCFNLTDVNPCRICSSERRDASVVLVVEQPKDLLALEQTGMYRGIYHVLTGEIDPLGGVNPEDLTVAPLFSRIDDPAANARQVQVREVVLGLNPTLEGDSTMLFLAAELERREVTVTRLARGLPAGSQLEYANPAVLADAIAGRRSMDEDA